MNALPTGWTETTLSEVTDYVSRGKSPKYAEHSDLPVVNQRAIRWYGIQDEHLKYIHVDQMPLWSSERFIQSGDVLWNSTGTGTIGRACLVRPQHLNPPKVVDSHVTIVRPNTEVLVPRYLHAWIQGPTVQGLIEEMSTGSTNQVELGRGTVLATRIPLPPLAEQKRIADKLDELLARVDACRDRLERASRLVKNLRNAIFLTACSGALTRQWRESNGKPAWKYERAVDVCASVQSGGTPKEGFVETTGIPFLKVYNIVNQQVSFEPRSQFVTAEVHRGSLAKSITRPGDVLMNIVGPPLGKVAVVPATYPEWNINQAIVLFRPSDRILTEWIYILLCGGENIRSILHETRGSAGQVNISLSQCRAFSFPVPPIEEQQEIVGRVTDMLALVDRLERHLTTATNCVERSTSALLAKAFRGELVPQDPNDEPVSVLLERSREARAESVVRKGRRGRKPNVAVTN